MDDNSQMFKLVLKAFGVKGHHVHVCACVCMRAHVHVFDSVCVPSLNVPVIHREQMQSHMCPQIGSDPRGSAVLESAVMATCQPGE